VGAPKEVFVLAGQSNMVGVGTPLSLASPPNPRLLEWGPAGWHVAADPLDPTSGIGPGMTFGLQLVNRQPGVTVGLVMCAARGTSINKWQPGRSLYQRCIASVRAAGGVVAGVLFMQGEAEASQDTDAATWLEKFRAMLAAWRRDLGSGPLFLLGQIGSLDPTAFPAQTHVRDAQAEAARTEPGVCLVHTSDLPNDGLHFTVPAYRVIGARFAVAWLRAWRSIHAPPRPHVREAAHAGCSVS
jgi:Carbohydrate esterase, sialic acid-specific acetylesterase